MPALLINIRINSLEKLELFKVTLSDIQVLFVESHIKIRGKYSQECVDHAVAKLKGEVIFYQHLQDKNCSALFICLVA